MNPALAGPAEGGGTIPNAECALARGDEVNDILGIAIGEDPGSPFSLRTEHAREIATAVWRRLGSDPRGVC